MSKKEWDFLKYRIPYSVPSIEEHSLSRILEQSESFEKFLDKKIKQLKSKGIDIKTCPGYFEVIIDEYVSYLLKTLEQSHYKQIKHIKNLFTARAADKKEIEKTLSEIEEQIISSSTELEFAKFLYEKSNPLQKLSESIKDKFEKEKAEDN